MKGFLFFIAVVALVIWATGCGLAQDLGITVDSPQLAPPTALPTYALSTPVPTRVVLAEPTLAPGCKGNYGKVVFDVKAGDVGNYSLPNGNVLQVVCGPDGKMVSTTKLVPAGKVPTAQIVEKVVTATPELPKFSPSLCPAPAIGGTELSFELSKEKGYCFYVPVTPTPAPTKKTSAVKNNVTPAAKTGPNVPMPKALSTYEKDGWTVEWYEGATDQMKSWTPAVLVKDWAEFPNVDSPSHGFTSKDGVEYGMAESAFCQRNQTCDVNVPAMHYRLITGDYSIPGIDSCPTVQGAHGCGVMLINVGTVTAMVRESSVDYGFTVEGRYWNGDAMPTTVHALLSHTAYNMLNLGATLGPITLPVNMGANCSSAFGCERVRLTYVVMSGNQMLMKGVTYVSR